MDRDERIQFMAAMIAGGMFSDQQEPKKFFVIASEAVDIALRIEALGYGGFEPKLATRQRLEEEFKTGKEQRHSQPWLEGLKAR